MILLSSKFLQDNINAIFHSAIFLRFTTFLLVVAYTSSTLTKAALSLTLLSYIMHRDLSPFILAIKFHLASTPVTWSVN